MQVHFHKYQGTGNDFVMIDNRDSHFEHHIPTIVQLCDRKFGIGADGLILIENHPTLDFEMVYFNADGSKSLCGNGSRCAVNFACALDIFEGSTKFLTIDGEYHATIKEEIVHLNMRNQLAPEKFDSHYFLNNGSPHHIEFVANADSTNVYSEGKNRRYLDTYKPEGTNVNFVEIIDHHKIYVRTYERGVEDETLSCGTGITASALAAADKGLKSPITIKAKGGELEVKFDKAADGSFKQIQLIGPAKKVFEGTIEI